MQRGELPLYIYIYIFFFFNFFFSESNSNLVKIMTKVQETEISFKIL